jgi:peptidoglycan/LPS O-acetylase OafA/YrhL
LDGLRAIAILGVVMAHDAPWSIAGFTNEKWKGYGGWGVELFFAISGVLICWRLVEDESRLGRIRLGAFYVRRFFRIQPAAWCFLLAVALCFAGSIVPASWPTWWSAFLSYANFVVTPDTPPSQAALLGHFWTLAVEEHFYLLVSLLFVVARRYRALVLALLLAGLELGQTYAAVHGRFSPVVSARRTYWLIQYLLFPALLALLVRIPRVRAAVVRYAKPWVVAVLIFVAMCLNILASGFNLFAHEMTHFSPADFVGVNDRLLFYSFGFVVIAVMLHPQSLSTRLLELKPVRFLGRLSYSVYLWHVLFFIPSYIPDQVHSHLLLVLNERPWKYLATAAVAMLSYYWIEKPTIRLGHRLAPPASAGHRDLAVAAPVEARVQETSAATQLVH